MNYEILHNKFQNRKHQLVLSKEIVVERLIKRYKAEEIDKEVIMDLINDDQLQYDKIFCCLKIDDVKILNKVFTSKEKKEFQWELKDNQRRNRKYKYKSEKEAAYNQLILDEMEGRRVDIILESLDDKHITGFLVRNQSEEIGSYISAIACGIQFVDEGVKKLVVEARNLTDDEYKLSYRWYLEDLKRWDLV